MANHHEVVDLGPGTDTRRLQRAAINGSQRTDLHIIADFNDRSGHAAPLLGEHTEEVLRELLQLDAESVAALRRDKVV